MDSPDTNYCGIVVPGRGFGAQRMANGTTGKTKVKYIVQTKQAIRRP